MQQEARPTTILFTDIEGSTRLWETQPESMSRALKQHDALARAAVASNHGIVVKMVGDGMYAVFDDPADALNATLALQEALGDPRLTEGVTIKLRCGLHSGPVEHRDNDFFGPPVNRSARIMGAAHGGQILVSQVIADSLAARLPDGVLLRDLGAVRLKDLAAPERVYQVVHPRLRQEFPVLRSLEATPNNLPQQLTAFIGREHDLAELSRLLRGSRLLSLVGMGGLGKTRLSMQVAADALDDFPDGVWFVDLAPIRDADLVASVVAQTLAVQEEPGRPLVETLCAHLKSRKALVILDNCEHLVQACAMLANALLRAACDLRIMTTSREALRVPGEQTYQVLPLAAPSKGATAGVLLESDAVQLFLDRARLHKPSFELTERDAPAIAELCTRLEGIPLALELAAARMRSLSITDINTRLRDRFKLLTGGGRVLMERQQTLRALVDWSYDLLSPHEQVVFGRLSVFAGGFDLEAAEVVCGMDPLLPEDVLDLLTSLVDKSLVMPDEREDGTRYRTLETIRDYARERLQARGEVAAVGAQHCDYFLKLAKQGRQGLQREQQGHWIRRLDADSANMRASIVFALDGGVDAVIAVKFQVALMNFWIQRGYVAEGRRSVAAALERDSVLAASVAHGHALYVGAALASSQGDYAEAERMLLQCLELRRELGTVVDIAATLSTLSHVRLRRGDALGARASEVEALGLFRQISDRVGEAIGLLHIGETYCYTADDEEARHYIEQAQHIARAIKHFEIEAECDRMLGDIAMETGDPATARSCYARSLQLCQDSGNKRDEATSRWAIGRVDLVQGRYAAAQEHFDAALAAFHTFEMYEEVIGCLEDVARLALARGEPAHAAALLAASAANRERLGLVRSDRAERVWRADRERTNAALSAGDRERVRQSEQWTLEQSVEAARAIAAAQPLEA